MKEKSQQIRSRAKSLFRDWNEKATIKSDDNTSTKIKKIGIRLGGILFITVFSPVIIALLIIVILFAL